MKLLRLVSKARVRYAHVRRLQPAIEKFIYGLKVANPMTITLDAEIFEENGLTLKGNRHILRIIRKRFRNIAKYTDASEVYVSLSRTSERVYLTIRDNGQSRDIDQKWTGLFISDIVKCLEPEKGIPESDIRSIEQSDDLLEIGGIPAK